VDDTTQENYWIVKNSWGRHFGLTGYFYVRRSTDEIAIESMALSAGASRVVCVRCI
jgi:C1A family cysteine protease